MERPKRKRQMKGLDDYFDFENLKDNMCHENSDFDEFHESSRNLLDNRESKEDESRETERIVLGSMDPEEYSGSRYENSEQVIYETNITEQDYRMTAYVNFVVSEGISEKTVQRMDYLMAVIYGEYPPFTKRDVMECIHQVGSKSIDEIRYYCMKCSARKDGKYAPCSNCERSTTTLAETVSLVLCDAYFQMMTSLERRGKDIVQAHRDIHMKNERFQLNNIRKYPGYQNLMETYDEFEGGNVNLICTISSDGARFRRISRREVAPMLRRVQGVDMEFRTGGGTMIVCALAYADGGMKSGLIDEFIESSLAPLIEEKLTVSINGSYFVYKVCVMAYLCDMKEQFAVSGLPDWHNINGCSRCITTGTKKSRGKVKVEVAPVLFRIIPPTRVTIDPFHVRGMGVCKFLVEELQKPSRWINAKLKREFFEKMAHSLAEVRSYTHDQVMLISAKKLGKATGREIESYLYIFAPS